MKLVHSVHSTTKSSKLMGGRINRSEFPDTIKVVSQMLDDVGVDYGVNLFDRLLGSAASAETCGDIDIAVTAVPASAILKLKAHPTALSVDKTGTVVSIVVKIPGSPVIDLARCYNGYVQVDLMAGDVEWNKQFYYSDPSSRFKGAHRNTLISAYLYQIHRTHTLKPDPEADDNSLIQVDSGPIFSPTRGFCYRIGERPVNWDTTPKRKSYDYTHELGLFDIEKAAEEYFGRHNTKAFQNVELLYQAINQEFSSFEASRIYKCYVRDYLPKHLLGDEYPWHLVPLIDQARQSL